MTVKSKKIIQSDSYFDEHKLYLKVKSNVGGGGIGTTIHNQINKYNFEKKTSNNLTSYISYIIQVI